MFLIDDDAVFCARTWPAEFRSTPAAGVRMIRRALTVSLFSVALIGPLAGPVAAARPEPVQGPGAPAPASVAVPKGYVIGAEDVLTVVVWREQEMSSEVVVRPDGKISLPLLNDVQAAGYTPEQLAEIVEKAAKQFVADSEATVIVKAINSRKVYVIGEVAKPGMFPLTSEMNVLQLIAAVGGLLEYADRSNIMILRNENGRERRLRFNYKEVIAGRNLQQNIELQPGDTILVR